MARTIGNQPVTEKTTKTETTTTAKRKTLTAAELSNGLTGVYNGSRSIRGKFGMQNVHKIGSQEFYGSAQLDRKLSEVREGENVTVKYLGMKDTENGRQFKDFDVTVND